jgi:hypothetical protein
MQSKEQHERVVNRVRLHIAPGNPYVKVAAIQLMLNVVSTSQKQEITVDERDTLPKVWQDDGVKDDNTLAKVWQDYWAKFTSKGPPPMSYEKAEHAFYQGAASMLELFKTAKQTKPKKPKNKPAGLTRQQKKITEASILIAQNQPSDQDRAFLARYLVQTTLPHCDPGNVPVWSRRNGNLQLIMQQGYEQDGTLIGHPYGIIPRLLMFWMTTEAIRTKSPRLELGNNLAEFMQEIGLDPRRKGPRSDRVRLEEQMRRLFSARIRFETSLESGGNSATITDYMQVASRVVYWWTPQEPSQAALWQSYVLLDPQFYSSITASPVPVDIRALRAIKRSPLALDLYSLLTYQAYSAAVSDKARFLTWKQLQVALGTSYTDTADLRKAVKAALLKVQTVYPTLAIGERDGGIEVLPNSIPAISIR